MEELKPQMVMKGITFYPVPKFKFEELDWLQLNLPSSKYFDRHDLPKVPMEYEDMAQMLMFNGGAIMVSSKIDKTKAANAVRAWLSSFNPAHEAKIATVAYALWLWNNEDALSSV